MTKINAIIRNTVRAILADSREFDASTMRISRDGSVSARKDADKTFRADAARYLVGNVRDMVALDGTRREGW
jgi:hypothetical protein